VWIHDSQANEKWWERRRPRNSLLCPNHDSRGVVCGRSRIYPVGHFHESLAPKETLKQCSPSILRCMCIFARGTTQKLLPCGRQAINKATISYSTPPLQFSRPYLNAHKKTSLVNNPPREAEHAEASASTLAAARLSAPCALSLTSACIPAISTLCNDGIPTPSPAASFSLYIPSQVHVSLTTHRPALCSPSLLYWYPMSCLPTVRDARLDYSKRRSTGLRQHIVQEPWRSNVSYRHLGHLADLHGFEPSLTLNVICDSV
jgi:hypothetical protein